jgi:hypothetical protein
VPTPVGDQRYFDGMLYLMSMLHCSGNFRAWGLGEEVFHESLRGGSQCRPRMSRAPSPADAKIIRRHGRRKHGESWSLRVHATQLAAKSTLFVTEEVNGRLAQILPAVAVAHDSLRVSVLTQHLHPPLSM